MWNRFNNMEVIQIVLDKKLLQAADEAAQKTNRNRSALVRDALREHLKSLEIQAKELRDRQGYTKRPQVIEESVMWEEQASWPEQ